MIKYPYELAGVKIDLLVDYSQQDEDTFGIDHIQAFDSEGILLDLPRWLYLTIRADLMSDPDFAEAMSDDHRSLLP